MDPITTVTGTQLNQSLGSLLNSFQTTLGISHTVFILVIIFFILPMILFSVIKITGSALLGFVATLGAIVGFTFMGVLPLWIVFTFGTLVGIMIVYRLLYIDGSVEENEKILCRFIIKDKITEEWTGINTSAMTKDGYKFSIDKRFCKNEERNGKTYKVLTFRVSEDDNMTNQLIQDPNKIGIKLMKADDVVKYSFASISIMKQPNLSMLNFDTVSFPRGTKILTKLNETHNQIEEIFGSNDIASADYKGLVDVPKMKALELDLYNQGIKVLKQVYEIEYQLQKSNIDILNISHNELTTQLSATDTTNPIYSLLQDRLEINTKSLSIIKKSNDKVDELLCQVELYTDSIGEMCLELPELLSHKGKDEMDKTLQELKNRISLAQKIKDEYVKEGI